MSKPWPRKPLRRVADVLMGQSPPGSSYNTDGNGEALLNGPTEFGELHPKAVQWTTAGTRFCEKGDILFCVRGSTTGRMNWADRRYCIGRGLAAIRAKPDECETAYLSLALTHLAAEVIHQADDGVFPNLDRDRLLGFEMPVPKPAEQRRLVARIEALTNRLEQARQTRQAALAEAETLRQAVWDGIFAEVPTERWEPIGTHAKIQGGYAFKSGWFSTSGIRLLRNQNVYHGTLEWSDTVHLPPERRGEFPAYEMNVGDVVISMDRPLISTGLKAARIRGEDLPCLLLQRGGRFQFKPGLVPDYLFHFLSSQAFMMHISGDGRSSAVPHISAKQIEGIRIPLPKPAEQRRIVSRLEALAAKQAELRSLQNETEAKLASFTAALLNKAFKGEF